MKQKWMVKNKTGQFDSIMEQFGVSEMTARLLINRNLENLQDIREYLYPDYEQLHSPLLLKDMDKACAILHSAIEQGMKIRVIGDYDVDGVVSTYILYHALYEMGAVIDYRIPERIKDGYGINIHMIEEAGREGVEIILTCDNGISAVEQVDYAKTLGIQVIITDHHDVMEILPKADALINPKQQDCNYPCQKLCGAAVALKLIEGLSLQPGQKSNPETVKRYIELVAVATICDVVELSKENRAIVKLGLSKFPFTENAGLRALAVCNDLSLSSLSVYHLGYVIGPCINAGGRLETAEHGMRLLLEKDEADARKSALELKKLNAARKDLTTQGVEEAKKQMEEYLKQKHKVLVLYLPECHESLAGIIAGKIREAVYRPTIVLTKGENCVKGSARSIDSYHITKELTRCSDLLLKFGGHPLAAGLSMDERNINELRSRLNDNCTLNDADLMPGISIDIVLPFAYIKEAFIEELAMLEPFGNGNPKPVFAERNVRIVSAALIGRNKSFMKLTMENEYAARMEAVFFGNAEEFENELEEKFGKEEVKKMYQRQPNKIRMHVTYYPGINEYNGYRTIQAVITDYQISEP